MIHERANNKRYYFVPHKGISINGKDKIHRYKQVGGQKPKEQRVEIIPVIQSVDATQLAGFIANNLARAFHIMFCLTDENALYFHRCWPHRITDHFRRGAAKVVKGNSEHWPLKETNH